MPANVSYPGDRRADPQLLRKMGIVGKPGCSAKTAMGREMMHKDQARERARIHTARTGGGAPGYR